MVEIMSLITVNSDKGKVCLSRCGNNTGFLNTRWKTCKYLWGDMYEGICTAY